MACRPGCTEFTVTPRGATSVARVFRSAVAPARAVLDRISMAAGWRTVIEVIATTRPQLRPAMAGTAAQRIATVDSRLSSSRARRRRGRSRRTCPAGAPAGVGHQDVDPAPAAAVLHGREWRRRRRGVSHQAGHGGAGPGVGLQAGHRGGDPLGVAAADGDVDALAQQRRAQPGPAAEAAATAARRR